MDIHRSTPTERKSWRRIISINRNHNLQNAERWTMKHFRILNETKVRKTSKGSGRYGVKEMQSIEKRPVEPGTDAHHFMGEGGGLAVCGALDI